MERRRAQGVAVFVRAVAMVFVSSAIVLGCGETGPRPAGKSGAGVSGERRAPAVAASATREPRRLGFHGRVARVGPVSSGGVSLPHATVCIPREALADAARKFSVLYATDGDYFVGELELCAIVEGLADDGAIAPWVVVGIPSTDDRTKLLARQAEELGQLVVERLEPEVAALVPLSRTRDARAILGYSYGGLAAVRIAVALGADFGRVVAMSPSLWFAQRSALASFERSRGPLPIRLYVDVGAREGDPGEVVPYMVADARALVGIARMRGLRFGRDVALREVPGQDHDMALAGGRLPSALTFALGARDLSTETPESIALDVSEAPGRDRARTFSVDATYRSRLVLSWPTDLASPRLGARLLDDGRIPPGAHGMVRLTVNGVAADRMLE